MTELYIFVTDVENTIFCLIIVTFASKFYTLNATAIYSDC